MTPSTKQKLCCFCGKNAEISSNRRKLYNIGTTKTNAGQNIERLLGKDSLHFYTNVVCKLCLNFVENTLLNVDKLCANFNTTARNIAEQYGRKVTKRELSNQLKRG